MENKPNPQSIRDLRMMYETTRRSDGTLEYEGLMRDVRSSRDYHEGDIVSIRLNARPEMHRDLVHVSVCKEQVTNLRDGVYSPKLLVAWSKDYTFAEFRESPFLQMCIDAWAPCCWDTHLMDEHEVRDEGDHWCVTAHVYEHGRNGWSGLTKKTGDIAALELYLDEDGYMELGLDARGKVEDVFCGDIRELQRIVREHKEMKAKLEKLEEHGIDLDGGTLSIRLWED